MPKSNYAPFPWKRNIRAIPTSVHAKIANEPKRQFVAGAVKVFRVSEIASGRFNHIGLGVVSGKIATQSRIVPPAGAGPYSTKNREGWDVARRDLPMVTKIFSFEVPNFGDWSKGSHTVDVPREVYQRDYFDPPDFAILVEVIRADRDEIVIKFVVDAVLDRKAPEYDEWMLFALNILQENIGVADVLPADAKIDELLSTSRLDWQIFPPGTVDAVVRKAVGGMRNPTADQVERVKQRVALFNSLRPKNFIQGQGGLSSYIGALFADDLVVFENVRYGNALYVLFNDWKEVSKRSRIDLLRSHDGSFERFVHVNGWEGRFQAFIRKEKKKRGIRDTDSSSSKTA